MPTTLESISVSAVSAGQTLTYNLVNQGSGVAHSSHPQFWKSPAHVVVRNDSSATFQVSLDSHGYVEYLNGMSTLIYPVYPSTNSFTIGCISSVTTNGNVVGASDLLSLIYYWPGEPLPHPTGR